MSAIPVQAALLVPLVILAAGIDVASRRIPNWLCGAILLGGLIFAVATQGTGAGSHAAHAAIALAVGMGLFALHWIGGGDAKLYAAVAAWLPLGQAAILALGTALTGLVVALLYLGRGLLGGRKDRGSIEVPYAVAIAGGTLAAVLTQAVNPA